MKQIFYSKDNIAVELVDVHFSETYRQYLAGPKGTVLNNRILRDLARRKPGQIPAFVMMPENINAALPEVTCRIKCFAHRSHVDAWDGENSILEIIFFRNNFFPQNLLEDFSNMMANIEWLEYAKPCMLY